MSVGVDDSFKWFKAGSSEYTMSSGYDCYRSCAVLDHHTADISNAMGTVWKTKVPSKIQVFGWRCIRNMIATKDQLAKRGIIKDDNEKVCLFCISNIESLNHLMVQCFYSKLV